MESKVGTMYDYVKLAITVHMVENRKGIRELLPYSIRRPVQHDTYRNFEPVWGIWRTWMNSLLF